VQGPRATAADVVASRLYHAAGHFVPCNRIVHFERGILAFDDKARAEDAQGDEVPLSQQHLDKIFDKAMRSKTGVYRASSSLFLEGTPLGPWQYQGRRDGDPNDVVNHEDRRELRGMRLLGAWTNHFDSREQNTLATWMPVAGRGGYVRHNLVDFGDCFGSIWEPPMLGRRIGHAYYFDASYVLEDFVTLGIPRRPWDNARFGPSGRVFGYYDVDSFDAAGWRPGYPNPAFVRMSERDGAWIARIIARFTTSHLRAIVAEAKLGDELLEGELVRILKGRQRRILERYLTRFSPLTRPVLTDRKAELCLEDMALVGEIAPSESRHYAARAWLGEELAEVALSAPRLEATRYACVDLPRAAGANTRSPAYLIVDIVAQSSQEPRTLPARVHLYHLGGLRYRVVGLERPADEDAPGS
jgi:hypothetical protein